MAKAVRKRTVGATEGDQRVMSYKKVDGLARVHMQSARRLKSKLDIMPDGGAKDFYTSLFDHYVKYGRWSHKQLDSVAKALGENKSDL